VPSPESSSPNIKSNPGGWRRSTPGAGQLAKAVKRQVGIRINRLEALWFDLKFGTATRGKASAAKLGLQSDDYGPSTGYQAVNEKHLRTVLEAIPFPPHSTFVDIGCGKGKALLIAADHEFVSRVVGVELATSLCCDARENVERLRRRGALKKTIDVLEEDAASYRFIRGENIFFVNNPFDWTLMSRLVDNICEAARISGRDVYFLYANPASAEKLHQDPRVRLEREFKFFGPGRNINFYVISPTKI
jgi:SAM-dependent methyltransferase